MDCNMSTKHLAFTLLAALIIGASLSATPVFAAASDYQFALVATDAAGPKATDVTVKLSHMPDGDAVIDAVIFETKADMAPSGMAGMSGQTSKVQTGTTPGTYIIRTETLMGGTWAMALAAKVQGEAETVRSTIHFEAK
jgi:hypothetical protein